MDQVQECCVRIQNHEDVEDTLMILQTVLEDLAGDSHIRMTELDWKSIFDAIFDDMLHRKACGLLDIVPHCTFISQALKEYHIYNQVRQAPFNKLSECFLEDDSVEENVRVNVLRLFSKSAGNNKTILKLLEPQRPFIVEMLCRKSTMRRLKDARRFFHLLSQTSGDITDSLLDSSQNLWPAVKDALQSIFQQYARNKDSTMSHEDMRRYYISHFRIFKVFANSNKIHLVS